MDTPGAKKPRCTRPGDELPSPAPRRCARRTSPPRGISETPVPPSVHLRSEKCIFAMKKMHVRIENMRNINSMFWKWQYLFRRCVDVAFLRAEEARKTVLADDRRRGVRERCDLGRAGGADGLHLGSHERCSASSSSSSSSVSCEKGDERNSSRVFPIF